MKLQEKTILANELVMHNIFSYLIDTGVIDKEKYIDYTESFKIAALEASEKSNNDDKDVYEDFVRDALDKHITEVRNRN